MNDVERVLRDIEKSVEASPSLAEVLDRTVSFLRRFVVLTDPQAIVIALWLAHVFAFGAATTTLYLHVTSAVPRAGKTRLLEVLEAILGEEHCLITMNISAAALYRTIDANPGMALLIDESDQLLKTDNDRARELFGLINSGSRRRGGHAIRVVGQGTNLTPKKFPTFSPKVISGIGSLVDTIEDRSVPIRMRRRLPSERIDRFREADAEAAAPIGKLLESCLGPPVTAQLAHARPSIPPELNDRTQDAWEPLLAIADLAGDYFPAVAREAAVALHVDAEGSTEERLELLALRHTREAFDVHGTDRLATTAILDAFINSDDGPWDEWWGSDVRAGNTKASARRLARLLSAFDIRPEKIRVGDASVRGYKREAFEDAWARNLGGRPSPSGTDGTNGTPLASDVPSVPSVPGGTDGGRTRPSRST